MKDLSFWTRLNLVEGGQAVIRLRPHSDGNMSMALQPDKDPDGSKAIDIYLQRGDAKQFINDFDEMARHLFGNDYRDKEW